MKKRTRPHIRDQVRFKHTMCTPKGEEVVWHKHKCAGAEFSAAAFCAQCELGLEPSNREPAEPHGWVRCAICEAMVIACPLGVAEGEGLGVKDSKDVPVLAGATS